MALFETFRLIFKNANDTLSQEMGRILLPSNYQDKSPKIIFVKNDCRTLFVEFLHNALDSVLVRVSNYYRPTKVQF